MIHVRPHQIIVFFEKYAVKIGGGKNHRYNLSDGVLLKDNHIGAAGGVKEAVLAAKAYAPSVRKIEIEVETLGMVKKRWSKLELISLCLIIWNTML